MDRKQIIQAIKENPQMTYEEIKLQATNAGVPAEFFEEAWAAAKKPKYKPILMAFTNFIIPGFAYIAMRKYYRFFIAYIPLLIIAFFWIQSLLGLVFIIMAIDTYIRAKKINEGAEIFAEKRKSLSLICGLLILIFFGVSVAVDSGAKDYLASSQSACKNLYPADAQGKVRCEKKFKEKQMLVQIDEIAGQALKDPTCEKFGTDETLKKEAGDSNYLFSVLCYFRKALETKNIQYCNSSIGVPEEDCISYLAIDLEKPEFCEEKLGRDFQKKDCISAYENKKVKLDLTCKNAVGELKPRCEKEFSDFLNSLKYQ